MLATTIDGIYTLYVKSNITNLQGKTFLHFKLYDIRNG